MTITVEGLVNDKISFYKGTPLTYYIKISEGSAPYKIFWSGSAPPTFTSFRNYNEIIFETSTSNSIPSINITSTDVFVLTSPNFPDSNKDQMYFLEISDATNTFNTVMVEYKLGTTTTIPPVLLLPKDDPPPAATDNSSIIVSGTTNGLIAFTTGGGGTGNGGVSSSYSIKITGGNGGPYKLYWEDKIPPSFRPVLPNKYRWTSEKYELRASTNLNLSNNDNKYTNAEINNGNYYLNITDGSTTRKIPVGYNPTASCLLKGTMILTTKGEIPIEDINENDIVLLSNGKKSKIIHTRYEDFDLTNSIDLYVIKKDTFAKNIPYQDTYLSPRHVFGYNGKLYHPEHLTIKGVKKCENMKKFTLYNIQMENYLDGLLIANGLEVESYLDDVKVNKDNNLLGLHWDCEYKKRFGISEDCKLLKFNSYQKLFKIETWKSSVKNMNLDDGITNGGIMSNIFGWNSITQHASERKL